jgi:hypothetical protein
MRMWIPNDLGAGGTIPRRTTRRHIGLHPGRRLHGLEGCLPATTSGDASDLVTVRAAEPQPPAAIASVASRRMRRTIAITLGYRPLALLHQRLQQRTE